MAEAINDALAAGAALEHAGELFAAVAKNDAELDRAVAIFTVWRMFGRQGFDPAGPAAVQDRGQQ